VTLSFNSQRGDSEYSGSNDDYGDGGIGDKLERALADNACCKPYSAFHQQHRNTFVPHYVEHGSPLGDNLHDNN